MMDQSTLEPIFMALLVTSYRFSQVDSIAISLPIISNLGFEKGVEQTMIPL
jgi:hypothetical protein